MRTELFSPLDHGDGKSSELPKRNKESPEGSPEKQKRTYKKKLRLNKGITHAEKAKKLGISERTLYRRQKTGAVEKNSLTSEPLISEKEIQGAIKANQSQPEFAASKDVDPKTVNRYRKKYGIKRWPQAYKLRSITEAEIQEAISSGKTQSEFAKEKHISVRTLIRASNQYENVKWPSKKEKEGEVTLRTIYRRKQKKREEEENPNSS